uniref:Nuclear protein MDM1 n=1 Tax=Lates calcarifer TaxID=8187 RepID=A0A4W6CY57_LATCA
MNSFLSTSSSAASKSRSALRKEPSLDPEPPTPPESRADPESPEQPETPAGPRPAADPGRPERPQRELAETCVWFCFQKQKISSFVLQGEHAMRWRAGLRSGGQRSGGHRSEYHRQFSWKKPIQVASPILSAEQVLYSSNRSVPPFKKNPVSMETEYRRSFQGLALPTGPRLRKHLEHQRTPLFHTHMVSKYTTPPHTHRAASCLCTLMLTEYQSSFRSPLCRISEEGAAMDSDAPQAKELRQKALSYRRRAWGTNFSRDHLNQLQSEHNALWEPTDTTNSATDTPTPRLTFDLCQDPDSCSTSCVEALDLNHHHRSENSSELISRGRGVLFAAAPVTPVRDRLLWVQEKYTTQTKPRCFSGTGTVCVCVCVCVLCREEGRLPTPRLKMRPVQRTHHDLTTPATGTHTHTHKHTHTYSALTTEL